MIYDYPDATSDIRQGDIFISMPRIELSLSEIPITEDSQFAVAKWDQISDSQIPVSAVVQIRPVPAIVITQDCDCTRGRDICLCEIRDFPDVEAKAKDTKNPKAWASLLTQHARLNLKWFYLPPDERVGFKNKMAADFAVVLRVAREDLLSHIRLRTGRLNAIADEHFRERLSEYYRRYPFDEWYPLNPDEFREYRAKHAHAHPFPWQKSSE